MDAKAQDARMSDLCVLYDRETGEIRHVHQYMTLPGAKHPSEKELEREARELAGKALGRDAAKLGLLRVDPGSLQVGGDYVVDVKSESLIERGDQSRQQST